MENHLAFDEALVTRGGEWLRCWEIDRPAVVLGRSSRLAAEVDLAACEADGIPALSDIGPRLARVICANRRISDAWRGVRLAEPLRA